MDEDIDPSDWTKLLGAYQDGQGEAAAFQDKEIDQRDKAENAVDYEDISDLDDLPEEEEARGRADSDAGHEDLPFNASDALVAPSAVNGFHAANESSADLFGDLDDANDLFGDRNSSPELERQPLSHLQPQRPNGGLALPTKTSLALPTQTSTYRPTAQLAVQPVSPSVGSPPYHDDETPFTPAESVTSDDDEEGLDKDEVLQRRLFRNARKRAAGEDVLPEPIEEDPELFYTLYPGFEKYQAPKFVELFPPRNGFYKGKTHLKPPKALEPTKLSLDLLQDQERNFKTFATGHNSSRLGQESTFNKSFIPLRENQNQENHSDDDFAENAADDDEPIGNVTFHDLAMICEDWDLPSLDNVSTNSDPPTPVSMDMNEDAEGYMPPKKKRKTDFWASSLPTSHDDLYVTFEEPERAVSKLSKSVVLDPNDPYLLIDEHPQGTKRKIKRMPGDVKRDTALSRDLAKRYNISNDQAYDLLKENHQHKVRSMIGSMAVEHSLPAVKLQYPFYRVNLDSKAKRAFHRPYLDLRSTIGREVRVQKPRYVKKKHWRGREAKDIYAKADDLSFGDNSSVLLLEYSEEAPMMLSNFGMGNRLINYYRKKDKDDQERPKRDIGETQVLLTQDKSPFANFGHVDGGEVVPTIQNGLFRAPVFAHNAKPTDFLLNFSSTYEHGDRLYMRNIENLHIVGQQLPMAEVPGQHSRKVTDASKKRLKALSFRIHNKSRAGRKDKVLNNATLMPHLPGHDMPQTRSKMREFMKYDKQSGVWLTKDGEVAPDEETMRSWIRPEDICLLDSMQVGVQHLSDLGITETKEAEDDKETMGGSSAAIIEQQLAPWRATKNFIGATQGKVMLSLWGDGDPTGCDQGFSFIKISMKGGFVPQGESVADKLDSRRAKESGGHAYNVQKQQMAYDRTIRDIWNRQKQGLSSNMEVSDNEAEDDPESSFMANGRAQTPRSSVVGTPAPRHDDDRTSQFSRSSATRGSHVMVIRRSGGRNEYGEELPSTTEVVTDPRVITLYKKRVLEGKTASQSLDQIAPTGDAELDAHNQAKLEAELSRIKRNAERREAREKLKANKAAENVSVAGSPGPSDADGPSAAAATPLKGKGRNKDGTQRKCANCGQVGHIKTNRKLCPLLNGTMKSEDAGANGDSSFGAVPAQLTL